MKKSIFLIKIVLIILAIFLILFVRHKKPNYTIPHNSNLKINSSICTLETEEIDDVGKQKIIDFLNKMNVYSDKSYEYPGESPQVLISVYDRNKRLLYDFHFYSGGLMNENVSSERVYIGQNQYEMLCNLLQSLA